MFPLGALSNGGCRRKDAREETIKVAVSEQDEDRRPEERGSATMAIASPAAHMTMRAPKPARLAATAT